ncbi:MAG: DUF4214 domain-containing protein [Clostridiales bacterium]|nr:DUF4214 domain-containing protein [Clostridiales bacterium]
MLTSNVKTRRGSRAVVAWLIVASMLASVALILGYGRRLRADVDADVTTWSVTVDLKNGDELLIIPVKDGENAYDTFLEIARQQDPTLDKVPDPEWDNCHVFKGWICNGEPYDLHTPVHKNTMIEATWEVINGGWEICLEANPEFNGELTDKGAEFRDVCFTQNKHYALWVCFVAPDGVKKEDALVTLDGGKTWEEYSKYANQDPREDGRYESIIQFPYSVEVVESLLPDKQNKVDKVGFALKSAPEAVVYFDIAFFPEKVSFLNNEGRFWFVVENWEIKVREIKVTYDGNGGADEKGETSFSLIHNALDPLPVTSNHFINGEKKFIAWADAKDDAEHLIRENVELPGNYFKNDVTLYALWADEDMWIVNFVTDGGSSVTAQMVKPDGQVVKPEDPTKEGMEFKYWTLDEDDGNPRGEYDFNSKVNEDLVIFAVWEKKPEPVYDFGEFVERLYKVALGRESEPDGKAFWTEKVKKGEYTGGYCALFFLTGPEFLQKKTTDEQFMTTVYATFFDREPEADGLAFWLKFLKDGGSRQAVVENFVDSKEWCNLCAKYGVKSGAPTAKAEIPSDAAKAFAERLYTKCLGREAEQDGLMFWALKLTNLEATGAELARDFFESKEYQNKKASDEEYVKALYETFMGREAEEDGLKYWVGKLKEGTSRIDVLRGFAVSPEFTEICASYGIERGTV